MVLPLTAVVPAQETILGIPSPAELPFTASQSREVLFLLYWKGLTKLVTPFAGDMFAALTVDFPNEPLCNFLFLDLAQGLTLTTNFAEEHHVVVLNHRLAVAFHHTEADQFRAPPALGRKGPRMESAVCSRFLVLSEWLFAEREQVTVAGLPGAVPLVLC
ncbi:hypothetical protein BC829DRAFT_438930 [Chytridium lagenaria]|nr:hypothetical protein BC829DRAFT_438930 [Chytridium lagenaria]